MNINKQKDIQNDKNNGHNKQYPVMYYGINKSKPIKDIGQKEIIKDSFDYVIKRTEKLATAIYIVTSLVSDTEPIKWTLRNKSIELLSVLSGARNLNLLKQTNIFFNSTNLINEIITFLNLSYTTNIISEMNFSILKDEYDLLQDLISRDDLMENENISVEEILEKDKEEIGLSSGAFYKGQDDHKNVFYNRDKGQKRSDGNLKRHSIDSTLIKKISNKNKNRNKNINREQAIKDIIKQKKEVTIKDISSVVGWCSEKTIQRELMSLIRKNIVKKTGEKRWSRYSLV